MPRYVDAHRVIENIKLYKVKDSPNSYEQGINYAIKLICGELTNNRIITAADVKEVRYGEWLEREEIFYDGEFRSEYPAKVSLNTSA